MKSYSLEDQIPSVAIKADHTKVDALSCQASIDTIATGYHRLAWPFAATQVADVYAESDVLHCFLPFVTG
jgi:hypothetical protein